MSIVPLKIEIEGPVTRTHYNDIIKQSLRKFGHEIAGMIGSKVNEFRDKLTNETKNFKFRLFHDEKKYVSFTVLGGWGRMFRSKYKIENTQIVRYDWRNNFWLKVAKIAYYGLKAAKFICHFVPGGAAAIPYLSIAQDATKMWRKTIRNDRPISIECFRPSYTSQDSKPSYNHKYSNLSNNFESNYKNQYTYKNNGYQAIYCQYFKDLHFYLISGCCAEKWCCWKCHNNRKFHKWVYAKNITCNVCANPREQSYKGSDFDCIFCFHHHSVKPKD
jgi:hypothetical protein